MATKKEGPGSGSSSRSRRKENRLKMEEILSQFTHYAERYQNGYDGLMQKILNDEVKEMDLVSSVEQDKKHLTHHLGQFTKLITRTQLIETAQNQEEPEDAEDDGSPRRKKAKITKVPTVMKIMDLIERFRKQAKINEEATMGKLAQVEEIMNTIEKSIEIYQVYAQKYEEATVGKLDEHTGELKMAEIRLQDTYTNLSGFAQHLAANKDKNIP